MKLPKVLARFRSSGAAVEAVPEPEIAPAPVEAAPARSRTERLNQWLALAANLGVLLGLIVLIIEVRQNAALTRAAMDQQKNDLIMLQWDQMFMMRDAGLISDERVRQHIANTAPFYFGSRYAKHWWALQAPGWEGTAMQRDAAPIIAALDEDFLAGYMDALKVPAEAAANETDEGAQE